MAVAWSTSPPQFHWEEDVGSEILHIFDNEVLREGAAAREKSRPNVPCIVNLKYPRCSLSQVVYRPCLWGGQRITSPDMVRSSLIISLLR